MSLPAGQFLEFVYPGGIIVNLGRAKANAIGKARDYADGEHPVRGS